jgi:hypothetical protein
MYRVDTYFLTKQVEKNITEYNKKGNVIYPNILNLFIWELVELPLSILGPAVFAAIFYFMVGLGEHIQTKFLFT